MKEKIRINWIDTLKCLGMYLVVIGHMTTSKDNDSYRYYIYAFHMPLFFMISGMGFYLQTSIKQYAWLDMVKNKIKGILIPYFTLSFIAFPIWILNFKVLNPGSGSIVERIIGIFYSNKYAFSTASNPMWFLPTLFLTTLAFYGLLKLFKNNEKQLAIVVLIIALYGYTLTFVKNRFLLPWNMDVVLVALLFFLLGYLFIKYLGALKEIFDNKRKQFILCLIIFPIAYCFARSNTVSILMLTNEYGSFLHFIIAAIGFSIIAIVISMNFPKYKLIDFIGKNTIVYLALHWPLTRTFAFSFDFFNKLYEQHPIIYGTFIFIILIPITYALNRWAPILTGKKKVNIDPIFDKMIGKFKKICQ